jgi:amino acid transporter
MPAKVAALTGSYGPLIFLVCGLVLVPIALSFAEVASQFRGTGGPILYSRAAFGPLAGFQTGWAFYVARVSAIGANVVLLVNYLGWFWEGAASGVMRVVLLFVLVGGFTWVNVVGSQHAMRSVGALTVLKFVPLLVLVAVGTAHLDAAALPFGKALPPLGDIGSSTVLVVYAFVGWENVLVPAGEARNPTRDMPRALLTALGMAIVLYVLIQMVCMSALPGLAASERPLVDVGEALLGPAGALLLSLGVIVSIGGNLAAGMFSIPRITYALARERLLPSWFGIVHPRYHTPITSVLLLGGVAFGLACVGSFTWLAEISVLARLLIYLSGVLAVPRLRRLPDVPAAALRLPGGATIPIRGAIVCVALMTQVRHGAIVATAVFLAIGSVLYLITRRVVR